MQFGELKRREFTWFIASAAVLWPLPARAQQHERMRRIGVLMPFAADDPAAQGRRWRYRAGPRAAAFAWKPAGAPAIPSAFADTRRNWLPSPPDVILTVASATTGPLLQLFI